MLPEKHRAATQLVIAGWTGRDVNALELEAIGVSGREDADYYRVSASLLTIADSIEVVGEHSSGEVEFMVFALDDGVWVGVGSDTDRKLETVSVSLSKQVCAQPVGSILWPLDDVVSHWDRSLLRFNVLRHPRCSREGCSERFVRDGWKTRYFGHKLTHDYSNVTLSTVNRHSAHAEQFCATRRLELKSDLIFLMFVGDRA